MPAPTCRRCGATLRFIQMDSGKVMPVNPIPDRTGTVAARKVGDRWAAGYIVTSGSSPLKPGFTLFRAHWADCPPDSPRRDPRGAPNFLF